jgi:membrane fusion protein, multidrug efflux system
MPTVSVSQPIVRDVTDYVDFTGRTEAPFSVDIRPRVTGYLVKMPFVEGAEVKENDLLFEIDPRPYQAQLDKAEGDVTLAEAKLKLAKADNARAKTISKMNAGAISQQDLDKYEAAQEEAAAEVIATKASLEGYKINLAFCKVLSPINGRISRYYLTLGNLANQDQTLLTTVVSQDPMYAYFDIDELTMLQLLRTMMSNSEDLLKEKKIHVFMGLADEEGFPHEGYINFANNVVSASTGTITVRGVFANPLTKSNKRLLRPGMFVRIRLPTGAPHKAVLVSEQALGTDQGRKYLLVVDDKSAVQYRPVTVGPLQDDGLRVIETGLKPGEWVVVNGLQLVRPRMEVKVEQEPMPVLPLASEPAMPAPASPASNPAANAPTGKSASEK